METPLATLKHLPSRLVAAPLAALKHSSSRLVTNTGHSGVAFEELVAGLGFFASALLHVIKIWGKWCRCLRYSYWSLGLVIIGTIAYWMSTLPLQWMGWWTFSWHRDARYISYIGLAVLQLLLPALPADVFWKVLKSRDKVLHFRIESMPLIWSKGARARYWALVALMSIALVVIVVCCMPLVAPLLLHTLFASVAAFVAVLASAWWAITLFAVMLAAAAAFAALCFEAYPFLAPFLQLWAFDPILAIIGLILLVLGAVGFSYMQVVVRMAAELYYSTTILTTQLLWPYAERREKHEWTEFVRRHCWHFCGFGLPIFVLLRTAPIAAVAMLEVLQGSTACLLADLLVRDGKDTKTEESEDTKSKDLNKHTKKKHTSAKKGRTR